MPNIYSACPVATGAHVFFTRHEIAVHTALALANETGGIVHVWRYKPRSAYRAEALAHALAGGENWYLRKEVVCIRIPRKPRGLDKIDMPVRGMFVPEVLQP